MLGMACSWLDPLCAAGKLLAGAGSTIAAPVLDAIGSAVGGAAAWMVRSMASFWMSTPTPALATGAGDQTPTSTVAFIQGHLWWYMTAAAVVGVLSGCGRMAWEQRADAGREVLRGLAVYVATAGAGLTVIALASSAADQFSGWIIADSTGGNFAAEMGKLASLSALGGGGLNGVILVVIFGVLLILASLVQMVLMVVRGGMLVLLAGVLPTTAAFTSTQAGRHWFRKSCGWLVAFVLYKPAAAIVYATAFSLSGNGALGSGSVTNVITGLMLMVLAILALPALMRFAMPMVGATAAGSAATVLAAGAGAAASGMLLRGPTGALRGLATAGSTAAGGPAAGPAGPHGSDGAPNGSSGLVRAPAAAAARNGAGGQAGAHGADGASGTGVGGAAGVAAGVAAAGGAAVAVKGAVTGAAAAAGAAVEPSNASEAPSGGRVNG